MHYPPGCAQVDSWRWRGEGRPPLQSVLDRALCIYMSHLDAQGCHRAGLEVCKLLLGMHPLTDPSHALLHLDYFALRSKQHDFLLAFAEAFLPITRGVSARCDTRGPDVLCVLGLRGRLEGIMERCIGVQGSEETSTPDVAPLVSPHTSKTREILTYKDS